MVFLPSLVQSASLAIIDVERRVDVSEKANYYSIRPDLRQSIYCRYLNLKRAVDRFVNVITI